MRGSLTGSRTKPTSRSPRTSAATCAAWPCRATGARRQVTPHGTAAGDPGAAESSRGRSRSAARPVPPHRAAGGVERRRRLLQQPYCPRQQHLSRGRQLDLPVPRSTSAPPTASSSRWICLVSAGWVMWSRSAALPKCRCSASVTKARSPSSEKSFQSVITSGQFFHWTE